MKRAAIIIAGTIGAGVVDGFAPLPLLGDAPRSRIIGRSFHLPLQMQTDPSTDAFLGDDVTLDDVELAVKKTALLKGNGILNAGPIALIGLLVLAEIATFDTSGAGITQGWSVLELASRIPMDVWHGYNDVLASNPVEVKAATSATVYAVGDVIAQKTEGKSADELDRARTVRSLLAGLIGHGPLSHVWYNVSEDLFGNVLHWTAWWSFIPKIVVDQAFWGPIWNNTYLLLLGLMKGESPESIVADMKRSTVPLVLTGLKLWPLAHCVTYGLIPVENRLMWVDAVEILWVTILATQANSGGAESEADTTGDRAVVQDVAVVEAAR